jgi:hypothetical protein
MNGHRSNRRSFKSHRHTHEEILANEKWFGDGEPVMGKQFTAAKAIERRIILLDILDRAARKHRKLGNDRLGARLELLTEKLEACRPQHRCGSLACPECSRAFQRAKVAGQTIAINRMKATENGTVMKATRTGKRVVMVTVIPLAISYRPEELEELDVSKINRWLKDTLARAGFRRAMLGSIDFSWEADRGIYQPHWHIAMFTSDYEKLSRRLKVVFPGQEHGDRPVVVSKIQDLNFLPYENKAIKIAELLRNNRRKLPYLLLLLDRTDPLELLVLFRLRVSAQNGELQFKPIR